MALGDCEECGSAIDPSGPAVGSGARDDPWWVPFVEDLRTSTIRLMHPVCFASLRGVDALVKVVHRHDVRTRSEIWDLLSKVPKG